jgi:hypothetical protein
LLWEHEFEVATMPEHQQAMRVQSPVFGVSSPGAKVSVIVVANVVVGIVVGVDSEKSRLPRHVPCVRMGGRSR